MAYLLTALEDERLTIGHSVTDAARGGDASSSFLGSTSSSVEYSTSECLAGSIEKARRREAPAQSSSQSGGRDRRWNGERKSIRGQGVLIKIF